MPTRTLKRIMTPVSLVACLAFPMFGQSVDYPPDHPAIAHAAERAATKTVTPIKIMLVGDSTTAVRGGWGPSFCSQHVNLFVSCVNLAKGGRSSYSFRAESSWKFALSEMSVKDYEGIYVLIQFGHNDQPGKPGRTSDLETEFIPNMRRYVDETRAMGATPVLLTPLSRRKMADGVLESDLDPWAEAVRNIAAEKDVALIDLYALSREAIYEMGSVAALDLAQVPPIPSYVEAAKTGTTSSDPDGKIPVVPAPHTAPYENLAVHKPAFDYTHLGRHGADVFSNIVALGLARTIPEIQPYLYADTGE